jgi:hypothetical protein
MSPSEIEEYIFREPDKGFRLTLASGDQLIIDNPNRALIAGLSLICALGGDPTARRGDRLKIISIPNIVLIEPFDPRDRRNGRRRR